MKITFVLSHANLSGGVRVVATYAERLKKRGHDVVIISTPKPGIPLKRKIKSMFMGNGWLRIEKDAPTHLDNIDVKHRVINNARAIIDNDVPDGDIVIATYWTTAEWVRNLSASKGAKAYFMQDYGASGQPLDSVSRTWEFPLHIITISEWLKDLVKAHVDVPVSLVPNSVDHDLFYAPHHYRQAYPTVGFVYYSPKVKGFDILYEAISIAKERLPHLQLVSFGFSEDIQKVCLPSPCETAYSVPDTLLKSYYSKCDAWLFGSRREGFGLPILEAMACRTPVISTPVGAAPELLSGGGGILVKPEDPEDMARAIIKVAGMSNEEWREMSDAAYKTATSYTWDEATDLFEKALHTAIARSKRGKLAPVK